jgi:hypothetical protein
MAARKSASGGDEPAVGDTFVGESYPAPRPPGDSRQRQILDRDLVTMESTR